MLRAFVRGFVFLAFLAIGVFVGMEVYVTLSFSPAVKDWMDTTWTMNPWKDDPIFHVTPAEMFARLMATSVGLATVLAGEFLLWLSKTPEEIRRSAEIKQQVREARMRLLQRR